VWPSKEAAEKAIQDVHNFVHLGKCASDLQLLARAAYHHGILDKFRKMLVALEVHAKDLHPKKKVEAHPNGQQLQTDDGKGKSKGKVDDNKGIGKADDNKGKGKGNKVDDNKVDDNKGKGIGKADDDKGIGKDELMQEEMEEKKVRLTLAEEERKLNILRREDVYAEWKEAAHLMDEESLQHVPSLRRFMPMLSKLFPERKFRCAWIGCPAWVEASSWEAHCNSCDWQPERCQEHCGCVVVRKGREQHETVERELLNSLKTWNISQMKHCLNISMSQCAACRVSDELVCKAKARIADCQRMMQTIRQHGILNMPGVSINLNACSIELGAGIPLATRAPPDDSPAIADGAEADVDRTLKDLAVLLNAVGESMVVEGHTGDTNPPEYWQSLAMNRAKFVVDLLETKYGVPRLRALPRGAPGGGVKVVLTRATLQEVFATMDADGDGMFSRDEFEGAQVTLSQWFNEMQISDLRRLFIDKDLVDFRKFCKDCGKDLD